MIHPDVPALVRKMLTEQVSALSLRLEATRFAEKAVSEIGSDSDMLFRIDISSNWSSYGESDTSGTYPGPLAAAFAAGIEAFKAKNKRSDVQAEIAVSVVLPMMGTLMLPGASYAHLMHLCREPAVA